MATKSDLEAKVESIEKSVNECMTAIRRMSGQISDQLALISSLRDQTSDLKNELTRVKNSVPKSANASVISRYE